MKLLSSLVPALAMLLAASMAAVGAILLVLAATAAGRLAGLGLLAAAASAAFAGLGIGWTGRFLRASMWRMAVVHLLAAAVLFTVCYHLSPDGGGGSGGGPGFRSSWSSGLRFVRASPANVVPEVDQVMIALFTLPYLDETVTSSDVTALRSIFLRLYREIGGEAGYRRAGSALGEAYRELAGAAPRPGHAFVYVPERREAASSTGGVEADDPGDPSAPAVQALPAIIVLHPRGGNLLATLRPWTAVADRLGVAVVAPTCGVGSWESGAGAACLDEALAVCIDDPRIDGGNITLAGIGAGAAAIPALAATHQDAFRRAILVLSGAGQAELETEAFATAWRGRHALVLHGERDLRLPIAEVERGSKWLEQRGVKVSLVTFPDGDHFLPWLQQQAIKEQVVAWLARS